MSISLQQHKFYQQYPACVATGGRRGVAFSMELTRRALDDAVAIVHIPVDSHVERHASDIFWTIERATQDSVEFFNITSNCVEMAIFAQTELVHSIWSSLLAQNGQLRLSSRWRVFEVSSGDCDDLESGNYGACRTVNGHEVVMAMRRARTTEACCSGGS